MTQPLGATSNGATGAAGAVPGDTRALLACGMAAAPLFAVLAIAQMLTRDGFSLQRQPASLLSTGELGWIQVANFIASGLLFLAGAVGIRRLLAGQGFGPGGTWGPRLIGAFAVSQIAAGVFVPDPANGFPPGTPAGPAQRPTWHSGLHFTLASLGFLALIVACLLVARGFAARRLAGWAAYSAGTGVLLLVGTAAESARANHGPVNLIFFVTAIWAFAWISVLAGSLRAQSPERKAELP